MIFLFIGDALNNQNILIFDFYMHTHSKLSLFRYRLVALTKGLEPEIVYILFLITVARGESGPFITRVHA